jgi:transposase-like protein
MYKWRRLRHMSPACAGYSYPLADFLVEFPDDDACRSWLWRTRHAPDGRHAYCRSCRRERAFKRYATRQRRRSWTCSGCGLHIQPTAGTIFEGSSTSLHLWFYAFYLMTSTRGALSAKQLERELGVTYKTARRMRGLIGDELVGEGTWRGRRDERPELAGRQGPPPAAAQVLSSGFSAAPSSASSTSGFSGTGISTGS